MKQDYQLKITLHFLLASLAEQENNDQNTVLTCKRIGGGENLEFMSYIPFSKFITRLSLGSKNYSYKLKSYIFEKNNNLKTYGFDKNLIKYKNNNDINYIIIDNNFNVTFYKSKLNNYYKYYIMEYLFTILNL